MSTWLTNSSAAESLFRALFEHNPAVVLGIDPDLLISDVNPAGVRISGYSRDELIGHPVTDYVPTSQRDRVRGFVNQALRGETLKFRVDAYSANGSLLEYDATLLPILSNNSVAGAYALLEDVTQRMHAERTVAAQREELMDLEHDFRSLFERNPDGIIFLTTDGLIVDVNQATLEFGGRKREEVLGQNFRGFLHGPNLERGWSFFRRAVEGESVRFEITSSRADGSELPLDITLFPKYAQGLVVGVYCVLQDITDRKLAHRKLEMQTQRVRDLYLLATTPEYAEAQVMTTLQTGCRLLGMESGAIVDATDGERVELRYDSLELFSGEDAQVLEIGRSVLAQHRESVVSYVSDEAGAGGCRSWIGSRLLVGGTLHGALIFFSHTRREHDFEEIDHDTLALMAALVGTALERRRTKSRLRTLAYYDSLTGLPNRLFFQERLRDALLDAKGVPQNIAVLFFDLDRFKDINDSLGHAMGDRFLQLVAHRLVDAVGQNGMVARMGGDEFIVLSQDSNPENAADLALTLLRAIEEPYRIEGYEQFITSSVGISLHPADGRDDQTLIKHADMAMYQAKGLGGNGYFFYQESLEAPMRTRLAQEKDLRRAIQRGQFVLHYQPIVDVATDRIVGVETLVRWNDPRRRTLIYPDEFIPTAEATGLITQLGEWIVTSAAGQMKAWHEALGRLTLAVNISARQFQQPNLCDRLLELLSESGLPPGSIELEITESMALSDVSHAIDALQQLKRTGMKIAVDDFGTGHSSLSYLRRFDVDYIKIDRSFIAGIGTESSDETIVKAIIAMGHSLGLTIVAEGVETPAQYDFLRAHGCDRVQGYLFSRPIDAAALEALVAERGTRTTSA